jgi:hypothetical protein
MQPDARNRGRTDILIEAARPDLKGMMMTDIPQWALDEAAKRCGYDSWAAVPEEQYLREAVTEFARHIAEVNGWAVDRFLVMAREVLALRWVHEGISSMVNGYRSGEYDHELTTAVAYLKAQWEADHG